MRIIIFIQILIFFIGCGDSITISELEPISEGDWYKPNTTTSWYIQLQSKIKSSYNAEVYDIDLFDSNKSLIQSLQKSGKRVICYLNAGSYEDWRSDKNKFPKELLGNDMDGWKGEKWLDISNLEQLLPIMEARLDLAVQKGCDGVDPDNMNGYQNNTGFALSASDQLAYNKLIANAAHLRGLSVGLKNDLDQTQELEPFYDFSINEQCLAKNECDKLQVFVDANKPVFNIEYKKEYVQNSSNERDTICAKANSLKLQTLIMPLKLDGSFEYSCH